MEFSFGKWRIIRQTETIVLICCTPHAKFPVLSRQTSTSWHSMGTHLFAVAGGFVDSLIAAVDRTQQWLSWLMAWLCVIARPLERDECKVGTDRFNETAKPG